MDYAGKEQQKYYGTSYRSIQEWKGMLADVQCRRQSDVPPGRIVEMIEGWLSFVEQREAVMPPHRRWECEGHLNFLFRRLSRSRSEEPKVGSAGARSGRTETHDCAKVFVSTAA